jgi:hypothetical protein
LSVDPNTWAIHFKMNGASHKQFFKLLIIDIAVFPLDCKKCEIIPVCREYIAVMKKSRNGRYVNPASDSDMPRDQFVAYGDLTPGDYDILIDPMDMNATQLTNPDDGKKRVCGPYWSWSDTSSNFWAAFFPPIDVSVKRVDLDVVFKPSNDEDGSTNINLTP